MTETKQPSKWRNLWPDVNDEKGLKAAINGGAIVGLWFAISYIASTAFILFTGKGLFAGEMTNDEQLFTMVGNAIVAAIALILAWRIWKRAGHISAIVILLWCIIEVTGKAYYAPGKGIIISLILLVASTSGVRGTLAKRKQLKSPAPA